MEADVQLFARDKPSAVFLRTLLACARNQPDLLEGTDHQDLLN